VAGSSPRSRGSVPRFSRSEEARWGRSASTGTDRGAVSSRNHLEVLGAEVLAQGIKAQQVLEAAQE